MSVGGGFPWSVSGRLGGGNAEAKRLVRADGRGPGDGGETGTGEPFPRASLHRAVCPDARTAVKLPPEFSITDNEAHRKAFLR